MDKQNNFLKGIDHIFKAKDGFPIRYAFRFHINRAEVRLRQWWK